MPRSLLLALLSLVLASALTAQTPHSAPPDRPNPDLQTLQADSLRMHALLDQMRNNLAFVQNTQSPLKHQFELEIDMWQIMLQHFDAAIERMQNPGPPRPRNQDHPQPR